jgi:hypothetical protein
VLVPAFGLMAALASVTAVTAGFVVEPASAQPPSTNEASPLAHPLPASSFTVQLAEASVSVDNLSSYSNSQVTSLVQWADRGMATTNPLHSEVSGEMETGDKVVVTQYGMYWLDIERRGGLLSGAWPIVPTATGPKFQYMPYGNEWEPNELLPGSDPSNASVYATGQGLNVLAVGGVDGSCTPGQGTFVIENSDVCGYVNNGVKVNMTSGIDSAGEHTYSFAGTLYQEGTNDDQVITDSSGQSATLQFTLTYYFRSYTDTSDDYPNRALGPANRRARTTFTITPSANINLGTVVIADNSDDGAITYPYRHYNYSNTNRYIYEPPDNGCRNLSLPAGNVGLLCEGSSYESNFITQPNKLPNTLVGGDFVTEEQSRTAGNTTDREMTAIIPMASPYRLPERIDQLWNQGLDVTSLDVDYFNDESVSVPAGSSLNLGYDLQTVPVG